jgi:hypothetical protein
MGNPEASADMPKRDPTLEEAIAQGFDCTAFAIYASVSPFYAVGDVPHDEHALGYPIACDERTPDASCRLSAPDPLRALSFRIEANPRARASALARGIATDAINISPAGAEPPCSFRGIHTLVSGRARGLLEPHIATECAFVPTQLKGASGEWFVLWVTNVVDNVDVAQSRLEVLDWRSNGEELLRPQRLAFRPSAQVRHLFRLPQWRYFRDDDLCTPAFRELVRQCGLTGFDWIVAGGTGPFLREEKVGRNRSKGSSPGS